MVVKDLNSFPLVLLSKVLRRLTTTESFNEAFTIIEESRPHAFKEGSLLAAKAEKVFLLLFASLYFQSQVFLTHMEIIRVKYPNSLHKLQKEAASSSRWFLSLYTDKSENKYCSATNFSCSEDKSQNDCCQATSFSTGLGG